MFHFRFSTVAGDTWYSLTADQDNHLKIAGFVSRRLVPVVINSGSSAGME